MNTVKTLIYSLLVFLFFSCGAENEKNTIKIEFDKKNKTYKLGEEISFSIKDLKGESIEKLKYTFQDKTEETKDESVSINTSGVLLGKHVLNIELTVKGKKKNYKKEVTILNNTTPKIYGYKIVNTYPHSTKDYTQGLEFKGDRLFEGTGKNKESRLMEKELETGKIIKEHKLSDTFFGEGLTIVGDKIHQLTWTGDIGFTYNLEDFKKLGTFAYDKSKQGWGLCYDGKNTIYKSDGTTKIWKLNAQTLKEEGYIQITTNKALKKKFNELEWVEGKIYANTWQKDSIAIINPENGAIEAIINLKGIRKEVGVAPNDNDKVLNGIAYKPGTKQLYVTGKYWDKLFEIEVVE